MAKTAQSNRATSTPSIDSKVNPQLSLLEVYCEIYPAKLSLPISWTVVGDEHRTQRLWDQCVGPDQHQDSRHQETGGEPTNDQSKLQFTKSKWQQDSHSKSRNRRYA